MRQRKGGEGGTIDHNISMAEENRLPGGRGGGVDTMFRYEGEPTISLEM